MKLSLAGKRVPVLVFCGVLGALGQCALVRAEEAVPGPALPLKVSDTGRYLADQQGRPFLIVGDTAWSIITQLSDSDAGLYLKDRQDRGFSAIIVNLLEHKFSSRAPATRAGLLPFKTPGDFSRPNPEYFRWAHQIIEKANRHGMVVWLAPAYLGFGGGDEGFFKEMKAGGKVHLHEYGRFIGKTFKDLPNIVWLLGGDFTPELADRWTVTELAAGIRDEDERHLMSAHAAPENAAAAVYGDEKWLSVNTVYSYQPSLFRPLLSEYARKPARPFVLIESTYEGEHASKPEQIRRQAYWSMLSGACGQFFGNNPIWHFDGPGLFPVNVTWQEALASAGSTDIARLGSLFSSFPWSELRPEEDRPSVNAADGDNLGAPFTATTSDRKLAVSYLPSIGNGKRELTINTGQFREPVRARWYNPATGARIDVEGSPLPNGSVCRVTTPGDNGTGANDWVLILEVSPAR